MTWKWLKWGSLFSVLFVVLQLEMMINVQADDLNYINVMGKEHYIRAFNADNELTDGALLDGPDNTLRKHPIICEITADNVVDGRITEKTKNIQVKMSGRAGLLYEDPPNYYKFIKARVALMTGGKFDGKSQPVTEIATEDRELSQTISFYKTFSFKVNLSNLNKILPLHIGFQVKTTMDPDHWSSYYLGTFTADRSLKNPTIDDGLNPTSTVIKGTGLPGSEIESNVNDEKTTVNNDGTYALDLKMALSNYLLTTSKVTITQHNQFGDFSDVSQQQLKMSKAENNPTFHIEDSLSYPPKTPDDEVIADLRKRLNIQVDDEQLKVQYRSNKPDLADFINKQPPGSTICILIHAELSGYIQSNDVVVKIIKKQENVIFTNQKSNPIYS